MESKSYIQDLLEAFRLAYNSNQSGSSSTFSPKNPSSSDAGASAASSAASPLGGTSKQSQADELDNYAQIAVAATNAKLDELFKEKSSFITQAEKRIGKALADSTSMMKTISTSLSAAQELTSRSIEIQNELREEVKSIKGNAVAALSIFVSFFAFITVSINVFSKAGSVVSASVLVFVFWCLLVGFNLMIGWQLNTIKNNGLAWFMLACIAVLCVGSIAIMYNFAPELLVAQKAILDPPK